MLTTQCSWRPLTKVASIALTLRIVCGFTTAQIARAFVVPETTVVLAVIYLLLNEGYLSTETVTASPRASMFTVPLVLLKHQDRSQWNAN